MTKQTGPGRPAHAEPLNSANFKLGTSDREKLNQLAEHRSKSRSEVVRELIQEASLTTTFKPDLILPPLKALEVSSSDPYRIVLIHQDENRAKKYLVLTMRAEVNQFGTWDWTAEIDGDQRRLYTSPAHLAEWVHGLDTALAFGAKK